MIVAFIDDMRVQGYAVESVCRVLSEQGCQVAARTYREWKIQKPSPRDISDAYLINKIWDIFHTWDHESQVWTATPESLYGRRKTTAVLAAASPTPPSGRRVARCLGIMGHQGVRRGKRVRTTIPAADGRRASDLLNREFTADAPNRVWVTDFT